MPDRSMTRLEHLRNCISKQQYPLLVNEHFSIQAGIWLPNRKAAEGKDIDPAPLGAYVGDKSYL